LNRSDIKGKRGIDEQFRSEYEVRYKAMKVLRSAKKYMTLRELSKITGIAPSLLSRYINGRLLPNKATSERILSEVLDREVIAQILLKRITYTKFGAGSVYDISLAAGDPDLLYLISEYIAADSGEDFDAIITPEVGGITFASSISLVTGKRLVIAVRSRPVEGSYIEIPVVRNPASIEYYYLRERDLEGVRSVIIVDDFSVRGSTIKALAEALDRRGVAVRNIYIIVGLGDEWQAIPNTKALLTLMLY